MNRNSKAAEFVNEEAPIVITGRNVDVTGALRDYAREKLSRLEKFNVRIIDIFMTIETQKLIHRVDIVMKVDHIKIKSHAETTDMYVSIDQAIDRLERQLVKYHQRIRDHQAKSIETVEMEVNVLKSPAEEAILDVNSEIEEENQRRLEKSYTLPEIIKKEKLPLKTLRVDEALMRLDLSGDAFLIYQSEEDRKLKVIYNRGDGTFGIIEPKKS